MTDKKDTLKEGQRFVGRIGGGILAATPINSSEPFTEAQVEARCKKANADAEALGIEARYEVRAA